MLVFYVCVNGCFFFVTLIYPQEKAGNKRHAPITFTGRTGDGKRPEGNSGGSYNSGSAKRPKNGSGADQRVYSPPSGKYSAKVANYSNNGGGGNNAGGGGGGNQNNRNRNQARRNGGGGGQASGGNNRRRR